MNSIMILAILRNPHGFSEERVREARLKAANRLEQLERIVGEISLIVETYKAGRRVV